MENLTIIQSSLIEDALGKLRSKDCSIEVATQSVQDITHAMGYEMLKWHHVGPSPITTPLGEMMGRKLTALPTIVPILRAGLEMWIAMRDLLKNAESGFIDIKRIDTPQEGTGRDKVEIVCSMKKFPINMATGRVIVVDPMLATGKSASFVIQQIKNEGVEGLNIIFTCVIACEEGINRINRDHPDVAIYCAAIDPELTKNNYIKPGLGDAGDKMYGQIH